MYVYACMYVYENLLVKELCCWLIFFLYVSRSCATVLLHGARGGRGTRPDPPARGPLQPPAGKSVHLQLHPYRFHFHCRLFQSVVLGLVQLFRHQQVQVRKVPIILISCNFELINIYVSCILTCSICNRHAYHIHI